MNSSEVVEKMLADIPGGKELDTTGITDDYIAEGTPIWLDGAAYKPLTAAQLATEGGNVIGFLFREVKTTHAYASICIRGVVNEAKLPFAINAAVKAAVPGISFI